MDPVKAASLSKRRAVLMALWRDLDKTPKTGRKFLPETAVAVAQRLKQNASSTSKDTKNPNNDPASDDFRL